MKWTNKMAYQFYIIYAIFLIIIANAFVIFEKDITNIIISHNLITISHNLPFSTLEIAIIFNISGVFLFTLGSYSYTSYQREQITAEFENRVLALKEHLEMKHSQDTKNMIKMISEKKDL